MMPFSWLGLSSGEFERMFPFAWEGVTRLPATPLRSLTSAARHCSCLPRAAVTLAANPEPPGLRPLSASLLVFLKTELLFPTSGMEIEEELLCSDSLWKTLAVPRSHSSILRTKHKAPADLPWITYLVTSMALL